MPCAAVSERLLRYLLTVALAALAYYGAGRIGLELAYLNGAVAALWPPAGLGLAVLFLYGVRIWPAIVMGDLALGDYSTPIGTVLAQTLGNTVALVAAALLLRRLTGGRGGLDRVVDVLALFGCALVAAFVSAAFGPLSLWLGDVIPADELGQVFRTWMLGDACGVLVVAPLILTWATAGLGSIHRRELVEGTVVLIVLVVVAELAPQRDVPYVVFPVLLWAAVRFGPRGAATAVFVVCSITVWNTAQNDGPFLRDSITESLLATQLFIAVSALTSLVLAAETAERSAAGEALAASEASQRALADEQAALRRVATLVASGVPPSRVFGQVTKEVAGLLALPGATVMRYDGARTATVVGGWSEDGVLTSRWPAPSISTATPSSQLCFAAAARSGWTTTGTPVGPWLKLCSVPVTGRRWRRRSPWVAGCGEHSPRGPGPTSRCQRASSND
jgi:integral membrane sensor domain MASE1